MESYYFLRQSEEGSEHQVQEAAKVLAGYEIATLCYGPLLGAKEAALIIAATCHCSLHLIEDYRGALAYPKPILFVVDSEMLGLICREIGIAEGDLSQAMLFHVFQKLGKWTSEELLP